MAGSIIFDCPHCGGTIEVPGDATEAVCAYCGRSAPVPPELRPARAPLPDGGRTMRVSDGAGGVVDVRISRTTADGVHMEVLPPQPSPSFDAGQPRNAARPKGCKGGCCLTYVVLALLVIAGVRLWFFAGYHGTSDPAALARQLLPCTPPQVPAAKAGWLAAMPLRTQVLGAEVVFTSMSLTNHVSLADLVTGGLASCGEYFVLDGYIHEPGPARRRVPGRLGPAAGCAG